MPMACQRREVTEPQRDLSRLCRDGGIAFLRFTQEQRALPAIAGTSIFCKPHYNERCRGRDVEDAVPYRSKIERYPYVGAGVPDSPQ